MNVAEYQITYDVPNWDGELRVFLRIEPDPYYTVQQEIFTSELNFFLPIDWDNASRVIALMNDRKTYRGPQARNGVRQGISPKSPPRPRKPAVVRRLSMV